MVHFRVIPCDREAVEQVYEERLLAALDETLEPIPADDLAIRWDTTVEFSVPEGLLDLLITEPEGGVLSRRPAGRPGSRGALARIAATQAVVAGFGVATECGFGRRDPATIPTLLETYSIVADPM